MKKLFSSMTSWSLIFTMVFPPYTIADTPAAAPAPATQPTSKSSSPGLVQGLSTGMQIIGQGVNTYFSIAQSQQAQIAALQQQYQMKMQLTPTLFDDKFFPGCKLLPARMNPVENVCDGAVTTDQQRAINEVVKGFAQDNKDAYEAANVKGLQPGRTDGIQCLEDSLDSLKLQLSERVKSIDAQIDKIRIFDQAFKENVKKDLDKIQDLNAELNGGNSTKDPAKYKDFSNLFNDSNCNAVISAVDIKNDSGTTGLNGIFADIQKRMGPSGSVDSLLAQNSSYEKEIRATANKYADTISKVGYDPEVLGKIPSTTLGIKSSSSFNAALDSVASEYLLKDKELKKKMEGFQGFPTDLVNSSKDSKVVLDQWKRTEVTKCLDDVMGITYDQLAAKIKDKTVSDASTNAKTFRAALVAALKNKNLSLDEKIALIKAEEAKSYASNLGFEPGANVMDGVIGGQQARVSDYLAEKDTYCETQFNEQPNEYGVTRKSMYDQAMAYKTEMDTYKKTLSSQVSAAITNRMINCEGIDYDATPGECNEKKLDSKNANFCLKQSIQCASSMKACLAKAQTEIDKRRTQQDTLKTSYEAKVDAYTTSQRGLLEAAKSAYAQSAKMLQTYFGADYNLPQDLQIDKDDTKLDENKFGIALRDPSKLSQKIGDKLNGLRKVVEDQNKAIEEKVKTRIAEAKAQYQEQSRAWAKLISQCDNYDNAYDQQVAQQKADAAKQNAEAQTAYGEYCSNDIDTTPRKFCSDDFDADFFQPANKAAAMLAPGELKMVYALKKICGQCGASSTTSAGGDAASNRLAILSDIGTNPLKYCDYVDQSKIVKDDTVTLCSDDIKATATDDCLNKLNTTNVDVCYNNAKKSNATLGNVATALDTEGEKDSAKKIAFVQQVTGKIQSNLSSAKKNLVVATAASGNKVCDESIESAVGESNYISSCNSNAGSSDLVKGMSGIFDKLKDVNTQVQLQ